MCAKNDIQTLGRQALVWLCYSSSTILLLSMLAHRKQKWTLCTGLQASLRHRYGIKIPVTVSLAPSLMDKPGSVVRCTISVSPEQAKIGMVVADSRGRVVYANSAFSTILHVPLGEQAQQHHCCLGPSSATSGLHRVAIALQRTLRAARRSSATSCQNLTEQCTQSGGLPPSKPGECLNLLTAVAATCIRPCSAVPSSSECCCRAPPGKLSCRTGRVVAMLGGRHRQPNFVTMDTQISEGPAGQQVLLAQIRPWQWEPREEWGIKTEAVSLCILRCFSMSGCEVSHSSLRLSALACRKPLHPPSGCVCWSAATTARFWQPAETLSMPSRTLESTPRTWQTLTSTAAWTSLQLLQHWTQMLTQVVESLDL